MNDIDILEDVSKIGQLILLFSGTLFIGDYLK